MSGHTVRVALTRRLREASHRTLLRSRTTNDWVGNWLCAYPIWSDLGPYRRLKRTTQPILNVGLAGRRTLEAWPGENREFAVQRMCRTLGVSTSGCAGGKRGEQLVRGQGFVWEDAETGANRTLKTVRKTGAKAAASAGRYWHLAAPRGTRTDH